MSSVCTPILVGVASNFLQVRVDVRCMHARFGGHGFFGFGDMATFQKRRNFPF